MSKNGSNTASIFIVDTIPKTILQKLKALSRDNYVELCNSMPDLVTYLEQIPSHITLTTYLTEDLKKISKLTDTKVDPRILVLESNFFQSYYTSFYKIKKLLVYINATIENKEYYVCINMLRALFEESVYFRVFVSKLSKHFSNLQKDVKAAKEGDKKISEHLFKMYDDLHTMQVQTRYDWGGVTQTKLDATSAKNILTHIDDITKASKMPFRQYYELLCEFVHPNYGSRTMIVTTRMPSPDHPEVISLLKLGDTDNEESLLWFLDMFSEALNRIVVMTLNTCTEANRQLSTIKSLAAYSEKQGIR